MGLSSGYASKKRNSNLTEPNLYQGLNAAVDRYVETNTARNAGSSDDTAQLPIYIAADRVHPLCEEFSRLTAQLATILKNVSN